MLEAPTSRGVDLGACSPKILKLDSPKCNFLCSSGLELVNWEGIKMFTKNEISDLAITIFGLESVFVF